MSFYIIMCSAFTGLNYFFIGFIFKNSTIAKLCIEDQEVIINYGDKMKNRRVNIGRKKGF